MDNGKSTLIGRLLIEANLVDPKKIENLTRVCKLEGKEFEYAFLIDSLVEERQKGISLDIARVFYRIGGADFMFIDAPGHVEFLKKMLSGATRADAAVLLIDAATGVDSTAICHANLLVYLGLRQVIVCVNKMDLVEYRESDFKRIEKEIDDLFLKVGVDKSLVVPISGLTGDNVSFKSKNLPWYDGDSLATCLLSLSRRKSNSHKLFRLSVQSVFESEDAGVLRKVVMGQVGSGMASVGDEVVVMPKGEVAVISRILAGEENLDSALVGESVGLILSNNFEVRRGDVVCLAREPRPLVSRAIHVSSFWLAKDSLKIGEKFLLRVGTAQVSARLAKIIEILDLLKFENVNECLQICENQLAKCEFEMEEDISVDCMGDLGSGANFVIVMQDKIVGGGLILSTKEEI